MSSLPVAGSSEFGDIAVSNVPNMYVDIVPLLGVRGGPKLTLSLTYVFASPQKHPEENFLCSNDFFGSFTAVCLVVGGRSQKFDRCLTRFWRLCKQLERRAGAPATRRRVSLRALTHEEMRARPPSNTSRSPRSCVPSERPFCLDTADQKGYATRHTLH